MRDQATPEPAGSGLRPSFALVFVFIILCLGIVAGGFVWLRKVERQYRGQVEQQLSAITDLKVNELVQWRKERLGDASIILHNQEFIVFVRRLLENPADATVRARIETLLDLIRTSYQYARISVLDLQGRIRLSVPGAAEVESHGGIQTPADTPAPDRVTFLDFHRDSPDGPIHLSIAVPLREEKEGGVLLGSLLLHIDPDTYLYPFIRRWPTPSETAETLLVRREGDEVLFLNKLRFNPGAPLSLRFPLTDRRLPAAAAVLGFVGVMEGQDYRGIPVLADVRPVPDSPWFLIARMDTAEVLGPLKERQGLMIGLVGALLFGAGAAALGIRRRQKARYFRERYETAKKLHAVSARQEALLSAIPDIIMEVDADKKYIWANPAGLAFFGEDVVGREAELYFEGEQETYRTVQPLFNGRENVIYVESWQRRKDGAKRLLAWWCHVLKDERGRVTGALSSGRDITEQKRAEEEISRKHLELQDSIQELERSRNLLNLIIESIPVRVFWKDKDLRYLGCNSLFAQDAGFSRPQELLGKDDWAMGWKDQADLYRTDDRQVMESRLPKIDIIEPQTTPSGATIWLRTSKVPLQNPAGEVFGVVGVYDDITERRRAAEALRESEEKFRGLFDKMTEGVALHEIVYDGSGRPADYRILDINPAYERYVGIAGAAVRGRLASEIYGISGSLSGGLRSGRRHFAAGGLRHVLRAARQAFLHLRLLAEARRLRDHLRGRQRAQEGRGGAAPLGGVPRQRHRQQPPGHVGFR